MTTQTPQPTYDLKELEAQLLKTKIALMSKSVFLTSLCLNVKHRFSEALPTAGTNGLEVIYNPQFWMSLDSNEQLFLMAHELWHSGFDHFNRKGDRDASKWNRAGDHIINNVLKKAKYKVIDSALCDSQYESGHTTETVYRELPDDPEGNNYVMGGDVLDPPVGMSADQVKATIEGNLVKAKLASEMAGKLIGEVPGEILRRIEELLDPKLPWQSLLQRFMTEVTKGDYTWQRPNRRYMPEYYLPSQQSPTIKNITVAVDTSGSVSQEEFLDICTEIQNIKDTFLPEKLTILDCDCKINDVIDATNSDILDIEMLGGGGTSIIPVMKHCEEDPPTCLIYFTDLYFSIPKDVPEFPILWISTDNHEPMPDVWGETIYINPE